MKMFSDCSGECCVCSNGGFCIAGHGDDYFSPASKEKVVDNLDKGKYEGYKDYMIKYLEDMGYHYDISNFSRNKEPFQPYVIPEKESFCGYAYKRVK